MLNLLYMISILYFYSCFNKNKLDQNNNENTVHTTTVDIGLNHKEWLDVHNKERCIFGSKPLNWDHDLAISSLNYAKTLKSKIGCNIAHNLDDTNNGDRGENLAVNSESYTNSTTEPGAYNVIKER